MRAARRLVLVFATALLLTNAAKTGGSSRGSFGALESNGAALSHLSLLADDSISAVLEIDLATSLSENAVWARFRAACRSILGVPSSSVEFESVTVSEEGATIAFKLHKAGAHASASAMYDVLDASFATGSSELFVQFPGTTKVSMRKAEDEDGIIFGIPLRILVFAGAGAGALLCLTVACLCVRSRRRKARLDTERTKLKADEDKSTLGTIDMESRPNIMSMPHQESGIEGKSFAPEQLAKHKPTFVPRPGSVGHQ